MEEIVRVGIVSSVDYEKGTVRIFYPDKNNAVSASMPYFSHCYEMPEVGSKVAVIYLSNGRSEGFVLGEYFNDENLPEQHGKGIIYKKLGRGFIKYDANSDTLTINVKNLIINGEKVAVTTTDSQAFTGKDITLKGTENTSIIT